MHDSWIPPPFLSKTAVSMRTRIFHYLKRLRTRLSNPKSVNRDINIRASSTNMAPIFINKTPSAGSFEIPLFRLNESLVRHPTTCPIIPPDGIFYIGMLTLAWAEYEQYFDRTLYGLLRLYSNVPNDWRRQKYHQRRKLFADTCTASTALSQQLTSYYVNVLSDSIDLYKIRNLIVHGRCAVNARIPEVGSSHLIIDVLFDSGDGDPDNKGRFGIGDIEMLCYEIFHLSGRLKTFSRDEVDAPMLSSTDKLTALNIWTQGQITEDILSRL